LRGCFHHDGIFGSWGGVSGLRRRRIRRRRQIWALRRGSRGSQGCPRRRQQRLGLYAAGSPRRALRGRLNLLGARVLLRGVLLGRGRSGILHRRRLRRECAARHVGRRPRRGIAEPAKLGESRPGRKHRADYDQQSGNSSHIGELAQLVWVRRRPRSTQAPVNMPNAAKTGFGGTGASCKSNGVRGRARPDHWSPGFQGL
jgi:hypothetical protein